MPRWLWDIEWNDKMAFFIPELDDEHRRLASAINDLNRAIHRGSGVDALEELMHVVLTQATSHFSHEESVLAQARYPWMNGHKLLHDLLRGKLEQVMQDCSGLRDAKSWSEHGLLVKQLFVDHFLDETDRYRQSHGS
jgi:hemerythrin-like metal-binding protein